MTTLCHTFLKIMIFLGGSIYFKTKILSKKNVIILGRKADNVSAAKNTIAQVWSQLIKGKELLVFLMMVKSSDSIIVEKNVVTIV